MRVSELQRRESVLEVLAETLTTAWGALLDTPVEVSSSPVPGAQLWLLQPLLSACYVPSVREAPARWIANSFRFTPKLHRLAPQLALGTALGSRLGLRLLGREALWVTPAIPLAEEQVVVPGNRRVRILDFARRRCAVVAKPTSDNANAGELRVRRGKVPGPFLPILDSLREGLVLLEPLIDGFTLPRTPPWRSARRYEARALEALTGWLESTARRVSSAEHLHGLCSRLTTAAEAHAAEGLGRLGEGLQAFGRRLAARIAEEPWLTVAQSHGDFQAGNVLIEAGRLQPYLIDWEYAGERSSSYDLFVYALRARFANGLGGRIAAYRRTGRLGAAQPYLRRLLRRPEARVDLLLFALEDVVWRAEDAVSTGVRAAADSLVRYLDEVQAGSGPWLEEG